MQVVVNVSDARDLDAVDDVLVDVFARLVHRRRRFTTRRCGIAGMLHYQLPTSSLDADRARQNPLMFADTGMSHLLAEMESRAGCQRRADESETRRRRADAKRRQYVQHRKT